MIAIPSDAYIRLMLDGAAPAAFDPMFLKAIETEGVLVPFQRLSGRTLIALDGTEHFCSRKIHCKRCSCHRPNAAGSRGVTVRADHGPQYISGQFTHQIAHWGMALSHSFPRQPQTNGVVERFFHTLKEQVVYGRVFHTVGRGQSGGSHIHHTL